MKGNEELARSIIPLRSDLSGFSRASGHFSQQREGVWRDAAIPCNHSLRLLISNPLAPVPGIRFNPIDLLSRAAAGYDVPHDLNRLFHRALSVIQVNSPMAG